MDGKIVLITGANSGIGFEASLKLARRGAEVVMVARDATKAERAVAEIKSRSGSLKVSSLLCDFASQAAIRALASAFSAKFLRLDVLINNAGSVNDHRQLTSDGIEQTFAVNHLGYFLLSNLLLDLLKKSAPARVVNVSSIAQREGAIDFDNLNYEQGGYSTMKAYARSKLSNVLFTRELARRLAGPALEGVMERARLGVAEEEGDLGDGAVVGSAVLSYFQNEYPKYSTSRLKWSSTSLADAES
jgi:NAD(P)-dependent dehydrogenase (short-subunit alcohol dehydrogenase family)